MYIGDVRMKKSNIMKFYFKLRYSKYTNFLFPVSSITLLIFLGVITKHSLLNGKPIMFKEWLVFMSIFFLLIVLPYDLIRWLIWGRKKYCKKLLKRTKTFKEAENSRITNQTAIDSSLKNVSYDRELYISSCVEKLLNAPVVDALFIEAGRCITHLQSASYGTIQRYCKVGFNRAARIIDQLCEIGIVESNIENNYNNVLVTSQEFEKIIEKWKYQSISPLINTNTVGINYDSMTGLQFESFCSFLLISNHFVHVETTQASGDHGIDILAEKDGITYAIQCKCYSNNVGNEAVQQALAGKNFYRKDIAVVLTNRHFTPQAKEEAAALGVKLWNREKLNELISLTQNNLKNEI